MRVLTSLDDRFEFCPWSRLSHVTELEIRFTTMLIMLWKKNQICCKYTGFLRSMCHFTYLTVTMKFQSHQPKKLVDVPSHIQLLSSEESNLKRHGYLYLQKWPLYSDTITTTSRDVELHMVFLLLFLYRENHYNTLTERSLAMLSADYQCVKTWWIVCIPRTLLESSALSLMYMHWLIIC